MILNLAVVTLDILPILCYLIDHLGRVDFFKKRMGQRVNRDLMTEIKHLFLEFLCRQATGILFVRKAVYIERALKTVKELEDYAVAVNIPDMVRLMKRTVPEFLSKNSEFEKYDLEINRNDLI